YFFRSGKLMFQALNLIFIHSKAKVRIYGFNWQ
ncbi:MAG: hypothetical protein ACJAWA_001821, partial [Nonlabens sp.]